MIYVFLANGFEEIEALAPVDILRRAELEVKTVGVGGKTITGSHGITVTADIEEKDVTTDDMELMILPGGMPGTLNLEKSPIVTTCAEYCAKNDIYLAAICAAPSVLGHLGLLNGKEAICFPGFEGELKGATISEKPVCVDGKIVTAKGMGVAVGRCRAVWLDACWSHGRQGRRKEDPRRHSVHGLMTDITEKNALRRKMRAARKACTDRATRDDCLLQRLMALSVYQKASCVLSYVSFGTEADTLRILDRVLADGKALYVPKCVPNTNRMVFYRISALRDLSPGAYGILEPKEAEAYQDEANALCLVPGLAFSADGARLGYGKGYYDTFFAQHLVLKLGLCYDFQLVPQVPTQPHDVRMDGILTDKRLVLTADEERME